MTYSVEQLKELAEVAKKYRIIILSDEIYGKLHHEGTHESIMQYYPEGTIFSSGLSKWCGVPVVGDWDCLSSPTPLTLNSSTGKRISKIEKMK
jgi:aspartate aminotransferase